MQFVWNRDQSKSAIRQRRASARIHTLWRIVWSVASVVGIVVLGWFIGISFGQLSLLWDLMTQALAVNALLWIGILGSMFLARSYISAWEHSPLLKEVLTSSKHENQEMSRFMNPEALRSIDDSFLESRKWNCWYLFQTLLADARIHEMFMRLGVSVDEVERHLREVDNHEASGNGAGEGLFKAVILKSLETAYYNNDNEVHTGDLLAALMVIPSNVRDFLIDQGVDEDEVLGVNAWLHEHRRLALREEQLSQVLLDRSRSWRNQLWTSTVTPTLDACGRDLTSHAANLLPLIGREKELLELYELVAGGNFGVLLVGPKGAGKTRFIEGLAHRIVTRQVSPHLADRRVVTLSIARLLALSHPKQPFKVVAAQLVREIARSDNIVIFLEGLRDFEATKTDEAALLIESLFADILKSDKVILLATVDQGSLPHIRGPLVSQLAHLPLNALSEDVTLRILEILVPRMEAEFGTFVTYAALKKTVELSSKFLHDEVQPGKSIHLLESVVELSSVKKTRTWITAEDVEEAVAYKTGLPVTQATQNERDILLNLEAVISEKYINQKHAVAKVASALRRARTELTSGKRPIANFLFLGPTGVGKTELAKRLADVYFGGEGKMVRLDMSEYQEPQSIRNLIGSPLGTNQEQAGHLIQAVQDNPFAVILLDEFEKAHATILDVFLQVLEDGRLTDPYGETYDFTNTMIIATSNAGSQVIHDGIKQGRSIDAITKMLKELALPQFFKPELLNRFDAVVVFEPLAFHYVVDVARLLLDELADKLFEREIRFESTPESLQDLAAAGYDPAMGARPLRRVIQDQIEDQIAKLLLKKKVRARDTIVLKKNFEIEVREAKHY